MENLAETNQFIELFEKLYDAKYSNDNTNQGTLVYETPKKKSFLDKFKKKEPEPVRVGELEMIINEVKNYLNIILANPAQSFWTLWRICQFIRWAEKIFLYKNNPETDLFVDSGMNEDERNLMFTYEDSKFMIKLQLVKKPEVKLTESAYNEVVTILIQRNYGKQMETKYISVDQCIDLVDDSDVYTINQVNRFLNIQIKNTFESILNKLLDTAKSYLEPVVLSIPMEEPTQEELELYAQRKRENFERIFETLNNHY